MSDIEALFQRAANEFVMEKRRNPLLPAKQSSWFRLASAIEDCFPEEIADYKKRSGVSSTP